MNQLQVSNSMRITGLMLLTVLLLSMMSIGCSSKVNDAARQADWILTNGQIYTVNSDGPWAEAIVIRDDKFVFVGDDAGARDFFADDTKITDLGGRMVIPGIVDGHTHPGLIGIEQYNATFEATEHDVFIAELETFADANPGDGWIRGCCWPVIAYVDGDKGPDREYLDAIFPDRPVWITSSSWHSYWLNTKAMEALGIDQDSEDPRFPIAMYKRDDSGRLTGWVKEGAGWQFFSDVFEVHDDIHQESVRGFLQTLSEHGVTTVYDGGNLDFSDHVYGFLSQLEKDGELPLRYEGTYMISVPERRKLAIAEMKRFRQAYGGERLQFNTIKLFMDGIDENRSGAMLEPYTDDPDYVSDTMLSIEDLRDFLLELHEEKFNLHIHVIGDLAVKSVLDAVEAARGAIGEDFYPRVTMAHLQNIHPSDRARFADLGVSANFTAWWHGVDEPDPAAAGLGAERTNDTYTAKPLFDAGANVTFSSDDWRLDVLSPFLGIQVGHTRQYPREWLAEGSDPDAFRHPAVEKLGLDLMLKGYTINGAYQMRMEEKIGSIQAGKVADFVVLSENLFDVDPYSIHTIKADAVVMEGEVIQGALR
jgi:predicted amidohydrolase YtcJ